MNFKEKTFEKKKAEALKRLELMQVRPEIIELVRQNKVVLTNSQTGVCGPIGQKIQDMVDRIEKEKGIFVYFIIKDEFMPGVNLYSLLYISDDEEEWDYEHEDLQDGYVMTYTVNAAWPECSEFGSIAFEVFDGVPIRIH